MAASASKINFLVLFFLLSSPLSTPAAAQEFLQEKSPATVVVDLKYTTKRLHRILVQLSSTLAQIIDNNDTTAAAADDDVKKTVESVREVLALVSILESLLYNHDLSRARVLGGGLRSEMVISVLSSLQSVVSSFDESSFPLQFKVSDDFSNLLKRLVSLISSLELDITAMVKA